MNTYTPRPGDIGLVQISGQVGKLISLGQYLNGDGFERWSHAFVVTDDTGPNGKPMIVEAEPGGAQYVELHYDDVYWCNGISHNLTDEQRAYISQETCGFIGTGYSFLDYFALAAKRLHLPVKFIDNYVRSTRHVICSQLAAAVYEEAGVPVYDYWTGDVTPGDLYKTDLLLRAKYVLI